LHNTKLQLEVRWEIEDDVAHGESSPKGVQSSRGRTVSGQNEADQGV